MRDGDKLSSKSMHNNMKILYYSWNPPPQGWLKVNIDDATHGSPGHSGYNGIFRTCRGFVKSCFSIYLGKKFAFEAEMMGLILTL